MAMTRKFDAIVIGTGQSGPPLADRLAGGGCGTAIIERRHVGGTCVNTGCIPTKTLVASARVAHQVRRAAEYGVKVGRQLSVDMKRVKARKDRITLQSRTGVTRWIKSLPNAMFYRGHARFESPRTVRVNDELLEAERIFINVGARALIPEMPGIDEIDYLTNSSMMHLVIIGGSYIGIAGPGRIRLSNQQRHDASRHHWRQLYWSCGGGTSRPQPDLPVGPIMTRS